MRTVPREISEIRRHNMNGWVIIDGIMKDNNIAYIAFIPQTT
jgi:hydrogenase maturation factor